MKRMGLGILVLVMVLLAAVSVSAGEVSVVGLKFEPVHEMVKLANYNAVFTYKPWKMSVELSTLPMTSSGSFMDSVVETYKNRLKDFTVLLEERQGEGNTGYFLYVCADLEGNALGLYLLADSNQTTVAQMFVNISRKQFEANQLPILKMMRSLAFDR